MNIVSFSGGKDSTAMLLMMLEKNMTVDKIVCVDTTKEFPQMYEHIQKVQQMIEPKKIEVVKIDFDYWFMKHVITGGKRKGNVGRGWPHFKLRWCTGLKKQAISYLKNDIQYDPKQEKYCNVKQLKVDYIEYHGIAFNELKRCDKNNKLIKYPLVEWKVTEQDCLAYCYSRGLDWGGLYKYFNRVSCWCCPFLRISELRILYNKFPHLWNELQQMDKKSWNQFRTDYSIEDLTAKFEAEKLGFPK